MSKPHGNDRKSDKTDKARTLSVLSKAIARVIRAVAVLLDALGGF